MFGLLAKICLQLGDSLHSPAKWSIGVEHVRDTHAEVPCAALALHESCCYDMEAQTGKNVAAPPVKPGWGVRGESPTRVRAPNQAPDCKVQNKTGPKLSSCTRIPYKSMAVATQ